jgi:hypothetical protein
MQWTIFFLSLSGPLTFPFPNVVSRRSVRSPLDYDDRMMECLNVVQCFSHHHSCSYSCMHPLGLVWSRAHIHCSEYRVFIGSPSVPACLTVNVMYVPCPFEGVRRHRTSVDTCSLVSLNEHGCDRYKFCTYLVWEYRRCLTLS